jgi:hypothetical protein
VHIHTYYKALMEVNYHGFRSDSWRLIYPPLVASGERTSFYVPLVSDPKTPGVIFTGLQHVWRTSQFGGRRQGARRQLRRPLQARADLRAVGGARSAAHQHDVRRRPYR